MAKKHYAKRIKKMHRKSLEKRLAIFDEFVKDLWRNARPEDNERLLIGRHVADHGTAMLAAELGHDGEAVIMFTDDEPIARLIHAINQYQHATQIEADSVINDLIKRLDPAMVQN